VIIIQRWLVFPADVSDSIKGWHLSKNKDVCGYMLGIPPALQALADAENWTLPHIYEEIIEEP
jgi:plasmid replication initiation protein